VFVLISSSPVVGAWEVEVGVRISEVGVPISEVGGISSGFALQDGINKRTMANTNKIPDKLFLMMKLTH
jgi:hypothetical protein